MAKHAGNPLPVAIAGTSVLVAFFNAADTNHQAVRTAIAQVGHLAVSACVLAEVDYLISTRHSASAALAALRHISSRVAEGRWEVPDIEPHLPASAAVMERYPGVDLADAMNVVLARQFRTDVVATLDRKHFRMMRPLTAHEAFRLLPDDVPVG